MIYYRQVRSDYMISNMTRTDYIREIIKFLHEETTLTKSQIRDLQEAFIDYTMEELQHVYENRFFYFCSHTHTLYSLLDGVNKVEDYIQRAKELGHPALAITDHRVTHGWYKMRKCHEAGIKPIYGCEVEVREGETNYHLVLLAMNNTGYSNIQKIVSWGHLHGFLKGKAAVPKEVLEEHNEGIIALSACIGGILGKRIIDENLPYQEILEEATYWKNLFKDRFYLEVQNYEYPEEELQGVELEDFQWEFIENQNKVNEVLYKVSEELGIPLIATNDVHYVNKGQEVVQDILLCINRKDKLSNPNRWRFPSKLHYMKDKWEMLWRFRHHPSAVFNTAKIYESCNVTYQEDYLLPQYPDLPEGMTQQEYFIKKTLDGLREFYGKERNYKPLLEKFQCSKKELWKKIKDRAKYEIDVFLKMGFEGYILIVSWCVNIARRNDVLVGHARGSAAGSIVALAHKITDVCPLKFDLLFERFLNPDRIEMPDIDVDFAYERRGDIIKIVAEELGEEYVAQIVTFGQMKARAAIRNVGMVMDLNLAFVDKIAKMVPLQGSNIEEAIEIVPELKRIYDTNAEAKELLDYAKLIEGKPKNYSVHAAGVILSSEPLTNHVALQTGKRAILPVIQAEMDDVDGLRLVKQDFLGLRNLSVITETIRLIKERHGVEIDPYDIPQDDEKTYEMLRRGESVACFQLESAGMRQLLKDIRVETLEDVVDCIALYRPGVLSVGMHTEYVRNKFNPENIKYIHPLLEPILKNTKGILIYQEQAMQIAHNIAGFSMADADVLRKAIGKKKQDLMQKLKQQFVEGCYKTSGIDNETATRIWDLIEVMASYSFNKSHSVGYAYTSIDTAFLKANYPIEYMCAAITKATEGKSPKVPLYIEEAKRMGIQVLPPDINHSTEWFSIKDGSLIFGLGGIKDVGQSASVIVGEREARGHFKDVVDFRRRCPQVNKKALTALIKAGCFDNLGINRNALLEKLDEILAIKPYKKPKKTATQLEIPLPDFDSLGAEIISFPDIPAPSKEEIADIENEILLTYISFHPLAPYKDKIDSIITINAEDLKGNVQEGQVVVVGGLIKEHKMFLTKKNKSEMGKFIIDDMTGLIDVISFPSSYQSMKHLKEKDIVLIKGRLNFNEKFGYNNEDEEGKQQEYEVQVIAEEMLLFDPTADYSEMLSSLMKRQENSSLYYTENNQEVPPYNNHNNNSYNNHYNNYANNNNNNRTNDRRKRSQMSLREYLNYFGDPKVIQF